MPMTDREFEAAPLSRAIEKASDERVRALLKSICAKNDEARKEAESKLLLMPTATEQSSGSEKRALPRYTRCVNCKEEFDAMTNSEKSCQYHPERDEPTGEDLYVDNYDEFDVDTDEMREDFPECFTFRCCDGNLKTNPDGCVFDFHREKQPVKISSKRTRVF